MAFGQEIVGDGLNAVSVTDASGATYLLGGDVTVEVVKPGPLAVQIRYAGTAQLPDDYAVPFTMTLDVPNAKSWVRYGARIEDPRRRIREVAFNTSFRLGQFPWVWDFGTGNGSYGAFRSANDSAVLTQVTRNSQSLDWQIATGPQGSERLYERTTGPGRHTPLAGAICRAQTARWRLRSKHSAGIPASMRLHSMGTARSYFVSRPSIR